MVVVGFIILIFGGQAVIRSTKELAILWGISKAVISLFLVALGTSLPELATCLTAAKKGKTGFVMGNILGSNLFNILWVLGACALIRPLTFPTVMTNDLLIMILTVIGLGTILICPKRLILSRWKMTVLLSAYLYYIYTLF
ncbi:hypothetical protein DID77_04800 [Candidatus Marinamargulisbacteria bacterium SCGC AG-439-L15]|nr:hypothetical protein DID77_04800 [Candidatus Marinamargulisbacteria bacterium SCGC AG-439-L15]